VREYAESIIIAVVLALFVRTFIMGVFKIPTGSMKPTLIEGDHIFVNKFVYNFIPPKRGEVVVFKSTEEKKKYLIKRLVVFGGETLEIKEGSLYINDKPISGIDSFGQRYYYNRGEFGGEGQRVAVPDKSFYMLGDNSAGSRDSRYWGFVPKKNLVGKAFLIYWPLYRIRVIK
jgi:signal peptidase I